MAGPVVPEFPAVDGRLTAAGQTDAEVRESPRRYMEVVAPQRLAAESEADMPAPAPKPSTVLLRR